MLMGDLSYRAPSRLKIDNRNYLAEATPLSFPPIAIEITDCRHGENIDQPPPGRKMSNA